MENTTLYEDLELATTCTPEEIKHQYRILAQIHHPDKGGDEEKFKRIKTAYETLSDPRKRAQYDSTGEYYEDMSINNEVLTRLSNMISHFTQQINPEIDDLILKMKVDIYQAQTHTNNLINDCNNTIRKLNVIATKIKLKKEGENILKSIVEGKIKLVQTDLAFHNRTLVVLEKMLEVLEDYHFSLTEWQLLIQGA
jgi:curved DNA-binding protein CbpA